ncbi:MAG TPA: aminotransferase class I/II-fold pyridoxal phosphate-dependent enzyme [Blastocatellia bacterium]|nr:aminotransferase class I/II-fold pyridoxal phosphate-dependent enzyme [Blastocatellia bacterium]
MNINLLLEGLQQLSDLQARWHDYAHDETVRVPEDKARAVIAQLVERLHDNYPFWHPSYAGQMLKPPHEIASIAYFLAQQINPNNHALDGGPATAKMETEVIAAFAEMFGFPQYLGHLTSSGTIANLEALWVARHFHPGKAIAHSSESHYTHARMCEVIGVLNVEIAADGKGRMDLDDLRAKLKTGAIGTVVMTPGTTSLGAVDPIHEALELQKEFSFRIHVDGAYGGFFKLIADELSEDDAAAFRAIANCDSIVVDPHKHGLQPYGCGSVLFRDPAVGRFYVHDSPYTYFTSNELHLGEISLECSRAGAAAAALWATLQCFPLDGAGLGAVLHKTCQAALAWAKLISESNELQLLTEPSLDIVAFFPKLKDKRVSAISEVTHRVFAALMNDAKHPIYLAKMNAKPHLLKQFDDLIWDAPMLTVFRSVLMKPEHLSYVPQLHERVLEALHNG